MSESANPKAEIRNPESKILNPAPGAQTATNFGDRRLAINDGPPNSVGLQSSGHEAARRLRPLILVVDDESDIVFVTRTRLQMSGYDVAVAVDGEMALARIVELHPDLVLLDLKMPKLNGYQVCRTVKADPDLSATVILVCSAASSLGLSPEKHCLQMGADGYFRKPYDVRKLLQEIPRLLAQRKATLTLSS